MFGDAALTLGADPVPSGAEALSEANGEAEGGHPCRAIQDSASCSPCPIADFLPAKSV